jgi:hypothetical protein
LRLENFSPLAMSIATLGRSALLLIVAGAKAEHVAAVAAMMQSENFMLQWATKY